jgi:hypothetical protein
VSDAALLALVVNAYAKPESRPEARRLVRDRLDAAVAAAGSRAVTIADSLAWLMLVTQGCTDAGTGPAAKRRRWWRRKG